MYLGLYTYMGEMGEGLHSLLQSGPALTIMAIGQVNYCMEDSLSLSPCVCMCACMCFSLYLILSFKKKNKS